MLRLARRARPHASASRSTGRGGPRCSMFCEVQAVDPCGPAEAEALAQIKQPRQPCDNGAAAPLPAIPRMAEFRWRRDRRARHFQRVRLGQHRREGDRDEEERDGLPARDPTGRVHRGHRQQNAPPVVPLPRLQRARAALRVPHREHRRDELTATASSTTLVVSSYDREDVWRCRVDDVDKTDSRGEARGFRSRSEVPVTSHARAGGRALRRRLPAAARARRCSSGRSRRSTRRSGSRTGRRTASSAT